MPSWIESEVKLNAVVDGHSFPVLMARTRIPTYELGVYDTQKEYVKRLAIDVVHTCLGKLSDLLTEDKATITLVLDISNVPKEDNSHLDFLDINRKPFPSKPVGSWEFDHPETPIKD